MFSDGRILLACLVWVMLTPIAVADEWKITGALEQSVEYDDNIDLKEDATPAFGYLLHPSFAANWNTAIMSMGITGRGDIRRYDDERWDCEAFSLGVNQQYQNRLSVFSLTGDYAQSCSYSDQLLDSGILVPNNQTETYSLTPAWIWQWSPLDQFSFSPSYSKTSFSSAGSSDNTGTTTSDFRGNETYSLNMSEKHNWTRRLSSTISLFFSRSEFDSLGSSLQQNVFGFQLGGQYNITRMWSISAGGGLRWVESPSDSGLADNNDSLLRTEVANLALNYKSRSVDYSLAYSRTVSPSALGQILEYSSVNMKYSYQINRELMFNIDGSFSQNQSIGQSQFQTASDRTYYTASIGLTWSFAREWQLSTSYRYRRQKFANVGDGVNELADTRVSNTVMFRLNYNWEGLSVSH